MRCLNRVSFAASFFFILVAGARLSFATPNCPQDHCSLISAGMNQFCISNGFSGKPYLVFGPRGEECFCPCSCMAMGTLIDLIDSPFYLQVESLEVGRNVKSPYSRHESNKVDKILNSDFHDIVGKVHHIKFSNGAELIVSPEHPFVSPNLRVLAASELEDGTAVLDRNHNNVEVVANVKDTQYRGKLFNIITNETSKKAKNHFIITNSIMSGDWLVQSNYATFKNEINVRMGEIQTFREQL